MKLLRLVIPSALLMAGLYLYANAQVVPSPGPPTAIACAYNSSPVTLTSGQAGWVQCNNAGALQVNASVSASVSGFAPAGTFATLTATGSSASVALPAGTVVLFQNTGTTAVSCTLGVGSATALVSENIIQPASWLGITVGANTFGACIDQTGSASNVVVLSGGAGLPTGAGGGSSSGGGGGAVTIIDGGDVALGTTTDPACAGDATSGCTLESRVSRVAARITSLIATVNPNGQTTPAASAPVVQAGLAYETVAASQTGQSLGATGGSGDYLSHCVIYPTSTSPGVVTVFDSTSSATNNVITFPGGSSSISNLVPISIPVGAFSINGAWKVTTGANLVAICYGRFT